MRGAGKRGESPALFTIAQVGTWRHDGYTWGWMGEEGWRYFRSQQDAKKFSATYQALARERLERRAA